MKPRNPPAKADDSDPPVSLREALRGQFNKPWSALQPVFAKLPAELAGLARSELWPWWDKLSEKERVDLANEADAKADPERSRKFARREEIADEIFNRYVEIRDLERQLESNDAEPTRDERIYHEVTERLRARERGAYKAIATQHGLSEKTVRNMVAKRRAQLGQSRPRRKQ